MMAFLKELRKTVDWTNILCTHYKCSEGMAGVHHQMALNGFDEGTKKGKLRPKKAREKTIAHLIGVHKQIEEQNLDNDIKIY